jgi:hypothetical protein
VLVRVGRRAASKNTLSPRDAHPIAATNSPGATPKATQDTPRASKAVPISGDGSLANTTTPGPDLSALKITTYEYEKEKDGRLLKVTDEKGYQTLEYGETTGEITSLKDSSGASFTASYDAEQNLTSETMMPAEITATTTRNAVGEPIALKYVTSSCEWFSDAITPSIHGQWMGQTDTLSSDNYSYNEAGWLTQVQETPAGKGCSTRLYGYDADGNRTSITKRHRVPEVPAQQAAEKSKNTNTKPPTGS